MYQASSPSPRSSESEPSLSPERPESESSVSLQNIGFESDNRLESSNPR